MPIFGQLGRQVSASHELGERFSRATVFTLHLLESTKEVPEAPELTAFKTAIHPGEEMGDPVCAH